MPRPLALALMSHLVVACASTQAPAREPAEPAVAVAPPPAAPAPEPAAAPAQESEPQEESVGVRECDDYLKLYRDCEPKLASAIAAGDRRAYRTERARLVHLKSSSEAPGLPGACSDMLRELEQVCR